MGGFIEAIEARGDDYVATALASATPSGLVTEQAYEEISAHFVQGVRQHRDADGVLLALHGAMVAEGIDDGEGELLGRIRAVAGDDMPIVIVLDLHSHITEQMVARASVIIGYQKYPHTDMYERGLEAAQLIARLASGQEHRLPYRSCQLERGGASGRMIFCRNLSNPSIRASGLGGHLGM